MEKNPGVSPPSSLEKELAVSAIRCSKGSMFVRDPARGRDFRLRLLLTFSLILRNRLCINPISMSLLTLCSSRPLQHDYPITTRLTWCYTQLCQFSYLAGRTLILRAKAMYLIDSSEYYGRARNWFAEKRNFVKIRIFPHQKSRFQAHYLHTTKKSAFRVQAKDT